MKAEAQVTRGRAMSGLLFTYPVHQAADILGTDGTKMSKSRGNAIELRDDEDRTAALLRKARTDSVRTVTYDPERRPEVAGLLLTAALCTGRDPVGIADEVGDRGAAALKALVAEAVNEHLRPLRARRRELAADPAIVRDVLDEGNARANAIADRTLRQVREVMDMA